MTKAKRTKPTVWLGSLAFGARVFWLYLLFAAIAGPLANKW